MPVQMQTDISASALWKDVRIFLVDRVILLQFFHKTDLLVSIIKAAIIPSVLQRGKCRMQQIFCQNNTCLLPYFYFVFLIYFPIDLTVPLSGRYNPSSICRSDVFPAPFLSGKTA